MKLISWNVNRNNRLSARAIAELRQYDVVCLQEVNGDSLAQLRREFAGWDIYTATEQFVRRGKVVVEVFLVTMTRHPVSHSLAESYEDVVQPLQYRVMKKSIDIEYVFVDVTIGGQLFRILNCHLQCVAPPSVREKQFNSMLKHLNGDAGEAISIICGDLNTYSNPLIAATIGWLLDYKKKDYRMFEARSFEQAVHNAEMHNPLERRGRRRRSTTLMRLGQLDYILVPQDLQCEVEKRSKRHGSDHFPICVRVAEA